VASSPDPQADFTIVRPDGLIQLFEFKRVVDLERECQKAKAELQKLDAQLTALNGRLSNPGFTDRAPAKVVEAERAKQGEWTVRKAQLTEKVISLCGS
jgi:valyl-tRNA synthetase